VVGSQRAREEATTPPPDHQTQGDGDPLRTPPLDEQTPPAAGEPPGELWPAGHPDRDVFEYAVRKYPEVLDHPRSLEELHRTLRSEMSFEDFHQAVRPDLSPDEFAQLVRPDMSFEELHQTLRPDMPLTEFVYSMDPDISFDGLMAVRDLSYQVHGLEAPPLSRENLEQFIQNIWAEQDLIGVRNDVYVKYHVSPEHHSVSNPAAYIHELAHILDHRAPDSRVATIQHGRGPEKVLTPENARDVDPWDIGFLFYHRMEADPAGVGYRVYVNAQGDSTPALMRGIVDEIVDRPDQFPGVYAAKVGGPRRMSTDSLVVYVSEISDAYRVVAWLRDYQTQHPDTFLWDVPAMTQQVMEGVGIGAEPLQERSSFGGIRADAIFDALQSVRESGGDYADFRDAVLDRLSRYWVDPELPHQNVTL
jgi:hypothetical protein